MKCQECLYLGKKKQCKKQVVCKVFSSNIKTCKDCEDFFDCLGNKRLQPNGRACRTWRSSTRDTSLPHTSEYVVCRLCGLRRAKLDLHILNYHGMDGATYRISCPDGMLTTSNTREKMGSAMQGIKKSERHWSSKETKEEAYIKINITKKKRWLALTLEERKEKRKLLYQVIRNIKHREKCSENTKAIWAARTASDIAHISSKTAESNKMFWQNQSEVFKKHWSTSRKDYWENLSNEAKALVSQQAKAFWTHMTKDSYEAFCQKLKDTKANMPDDKYYTWLDNLRKVWERLTPAEYAEKCRSLQQSKTDMPWEDWEAWREKQRRAWASLSPDARKAKCLKLHKARVLELNTQTAETLAQRATVKKASCIIDGKLLQFDSTWEIALYKLLKRLNIKFYYVNEHAYTGFKLYDDIWWLPDFILPDHNLILEVKGKRWDNKKFKQKAKHFIEIYGHSFSVALIRFDVSKKQKYDSLDALLKDVDFQHTSNRTPLKIKFKTDALLRDFDSIKKQTGSYQASPTNNKIIYHFQTHFYEVERELWKKPETREKLLSNREEYLKRERHAFTISEILRGFKISGIHRGFSHFSSRWLKAFIEQYKITSIYDPCAGWGHRLLGAASAGIPYRGNDIDPRTVAGLKLIRDFIKADAKITCHDSSAWHPQGQYDAVFTCPPYFDTELYTSENTSTSIFSSYDAWLNKWWINTVKNALKVKPRLFAFVISQKYKDDMKSIVEKTGLTLIEDIALNEGSNDHFQRTTTKRKGETLLVFTCSL